MDKTTIIDLPGLKRKRGKRRKQDGGNITKCILCFSKLTQFELAKKRILCFECTEVLRERFEYNPPPERPVYPVVERAYAQLLIAVRKQASLDHKLRDWREYWIKESGLYKEMQEAISLLISDHSVHHVEMVHEKGRQVAE